jgi:transcriptional regulator with XRE-family HTH domain
LQLFFPLCIIFVVGRIKAFNNIDSFGERLKLVRLCFQITQSELADLIGITQGTLTKIERNLFIPEKDMVEKISDRFYLNPLYLRYGGAPIFTKKMILGDFLISDRNRKLQNLLSGDIIKKIIIYFLSKEQVHEGYMISGKSVYSVFIFASNLGYPHYLFFRTDIEAGTSIRETVSEQKFKTHYFNDDDLLGALDSIYEISTNDHFDLFKERLDEIGIPQNMHFLLEFSENEMLSPLIIAEIGINHDMVQKLADFFVANKVTENDIRAALKQLKEIRKSEEN